MHNIPVRQVYFSVCLFVFAYVVAISSERVGAESAARDGAITCAGIGALFFLVMSQQKINGLLGGARLRLVLFRAGIGYLCGGVIGGVAAFLVHFVRWSLI